MKFNLNEIYLRRKNKLFLEKKKNASELNVTYIATLLHNLKNLNYTLSPELIEILETYSLEEFTEFQKELISNLKKLVGAHVKYKPMYPNFPKQVMEASEAELYMNAIMHYMGDVLGLRILPKYKKEKRDNLNEEFNLTVINLGSKEDFFQIFKNILNSKSSISEQDKQDLECYVVNNKSKVKIDEIVPNEIYFKETLAYFSNLLNKIKYDKAASVIKKFVSTPVDALRIVVASFDGDISLSKPTKFGKISRSHRKFILELLEASSLDFDSAMAYKEVWKRLGEILHPNDYRKQFPNTVNFFNILRNTKDFSEKTFNSKIETSIENNKTKETIELLSSRPTLFARRLDEVLRSVSDIKKKEILDAFEKIVDKVSTPAILQMMTHFKHRNESNSRTAFPKGNTSKFVIFEASDIEIKQKFIDRVTSISETELLKRFSKKGKLGKVYISEDIKGCTIPFSLRSASKALKTLARCSRLKFEDDKDTIRFFIWWKDKENERVDIDLSAVAFDENFVEAGHLTYYNLRDMNLGVHSGDITSAPKGASEFIDISVSKALKKGIRYIAMNVNSFTQQPYSELPECFAGIMTREKAQSGEIYEPRTVKNKVDLTSETKSCVPLIIDLITKEIVWTDMAMPINSWRPNNVRNNERTLNNLVKAMITANKPNLYELFKLHAKSRGKIVNNINDADTVFSVEKGITPFDTEKILSEYL